MHHVGDALADGGGDVADGAQDAPAALAPDGGGLRGRTKRIGTGNEADFSVGKKSCGMGYSRWYVQG